MAYLAAATSPHRYQWESNASPSQSVNCGPTCVTKIAQFYRDTWYGIQATRRLVTPELYRGTSANQQASMLAKRGVSNSIVRIDSLSQLRQIVGSGRRPILIGMQMARVSAVYRDHPFLGWHAVTVLSSGTLNGYGGFWVNDPNFSPPGGIRPDPDRGRKWYPDWVMQHALINNYPRWAVVPRAAKTVVQPSTGNLVVNGGSRIRHYPYSGRLLRILSANTRAVNKGDFKGDPYSWYVNGVLKRSVSPHVWKKVQFADGLVGYVIKPFTRVVSGAVLAAEVEEDREVDLEDLNLHEYSEAEASEFVEDEVPAEVMEMPDEPLELTRPPLWVPGQKAELSGLYVGDKGGMEIALSREDRFPPPTPGNTGWELVRATIERGR